MRNNVGVVIATYNGERYIEEQLNSIINQSIRPDIVVISDGGSNDNTVSICEKILQEDGIKHLILTSKKQLSVKINFERAISACDAEYIFCADQDDYWLKDKIFDFLSIFRKNNPDMVFSNAFIVDENLNKTGTKLWETIGYNSQKEMEVYEKGSIEFRKLLYKHNVVTGMCMAFRGDLKDEVLPFSNNAIHDVWLAFKINQLGKVIALNKCEVLYRQHKNNVIGTHSSLQNSFMHKNGYYSRIIQRIDFIKDVSGDCDNKLEQLDKQYIAHLQWRKEFVEGTKGIKNIFQKLGAYKQYEYKWFLIILKDIYTRWNPKK